MKDLWDVIFIFLIPFGGGIPAGVLLAEKNAIPWPMIMFLYFISDIILALCFEPLLFLFIKYGKKNQFLYRFSVVCKMMVTKTLEHYGNTSGGIFALIMIAFGVDPMTGRAVAVAAGHGFLTGWMIAIAGDMLYFTLLMASTLWLNNILGDGTWTMMIILFFMMVFPTVLRKISKN